MTSALKLMFLCLMGSLIALSPAASSVYADNDNDHDLSLTVNDEVVNVDMFMKENRIQIDRSSASELIDSEVDVQEDYVPLRRAFEDKGAEVEWNGETKTAHIRRPETESTAEAIETEAETDTDNDEEHDQDKIQKPEEPTAEDIAILAEEYMEEKNTYKMEGEGELSFHLPTEEGLADEGTDSEMKLPFDISANVRHDPFSIYLVQEMTFPMAEDLGNEENDLSTETDKESDESMNSEAALQTMDESHMYMTEDHMYQRYDEDLWVVTELSDMDMDDTFQYFMNMDPAASLELSQKYGIEYSLKEDTKIDGEDYYIVNMSMDEEAFKDIMEDHLRAEDFTESLNEGLSSGEDQDLSDEELSEDEQANTAEDDTEEELGEELDEEFAAFMEEFLDNINMNMDYDMYVNKDTLETKKVESLIKYSIKLPDTAEMAEMTLSQTAKVYDYGSELDFPEIEDAITQTELQEKLMKEYENKEYE